MYDAGYPFSALRFYGWDAYVYGLGIPLMVACFAGVIYLVRRPTRADWIWVPWVILFYLTLFTTGWRLIRWIMPMAPFFFLQAARLWDDEQFWGRWRAVSHLLAAVVVGYTTLYSFAYVQSMTTPDTRDVSSEWIVKNIPRGSRIAIYGNPYFWAPTIFQSPRFHPEEEVELRNKYGFEMRYIFGYRKELQDVHPTHVMTADYETNVYVRDPEYYQRYPEGQYMAEILDPKKYKVLAEFGKQVELAGHRWFGNMDDYPHDWRYPFPKIVILGRVS